MLESFRSSPPELFYRQPELTDPRIDMGEPARIGDAMTIVSHSFGRPVDNEELLKIALRFGLPSSDIPAAKTAIDATGFTTRYFSHPIEEAPDFAAAAELASTHGSLILRESMESKKWDVIDMLIDTSAFLPCSVNQAILEKTGLDPKKVVSQSYRYACAGAIGAFIDCVANKDIPRDARVVIAALEPLSILINKSHFLTPSGLTIPSIFGNGYAALAFQPGNFELLQKEILVQPDAGVIKIPTHYDFDQQPSDNKAVPQHYQFGEGGEDIFRYSKTGAFLDITPPAPNLSIEMNGVETGLFFGDNTADLLINLLKKNGNPDLLRQLGEKNLIMHPASKAVVNRVAKLLLRSGYIDERYLPFLMDKAHQSNASSATTLNRWRYMIENDLIDTNQPMVWIAPGIGSAIAGAIGTVNPNSLE